MLLDVRTYTCFPGTLNKHLALYDKMGKGPQTKHLGQPFAYLVTETGNPNQYIHIWQRADKPAKQNSLTTQGAPEHSLTNRSTQCKLRY